VLQRWWWHPVAEGGGQPCKYLIKVTYCKEMPLPWPPLIFFSCSTSGGTFNIIKTTNLPGIGLTIHMNNKIA